MGYVVFIMAIHTSMQSAVVCYLSHHRVALKLVGTQAQGKPVHLVRTHMLKARASFTYLFTPSSESLEHPAGVVMEAGSHGKGCLDFGLITDNPPAQESLFKPKAPADRT